MKKIKVGFWSDAPVIPTGWGNVARFIIKFLDKEKYDVFCVGVSYFGDPHDLPNVRIYPAASKGNIYGLNRVQEIFEAEKPDIIFVINDAWVLDVMLQKLKEIYPSETRPKIVTYHPVDAKDHNPAWYKNFDIVDECVVYNQFGLEVTKRAYPREKGFKVIGHGVDTSIFYQLHENRAEAKKELYPNNKELEDSFIVLSAQRNQPRKKLDITMKGFALFAQDKPSNVKLYMHCGLQDSSISIPAMANRLGIESRLVVTSGVNGIQRVPYEMLNLIYNATDVGINTSLGEGFSLITAEHAATGAAQIIGNYSSPVEVFGGVSVLLDPIQEFTLDDIMTTGYLIAPETVAQALQLLYENKDLRDKIALAGQKRFTSKEFSWEYIAGQWDKLFTSLL